LFGKYIIHLVDSTCSLDIILDFNSLIVLTSNILQTRAKWFYKSSRQWERRVSPLAHCLSSNATSLYWVWLPHLRIF